MSTLTAATVLPLIHALPQDEKEVLAQEIRKLLSPIKRMKPKKDAYKNIADHFRPENKELLVSMIIHNTL